MLRLVPPGAYTGEWIGQLCVPDDLYWVARQPVALAGMSYPGRADWHLLHAHVESRIPTLELGNEVTHDLTLPSHRPEADRGILGAGRLRAGGRQG